MKRPYVVVMAKVDVGRGRKAEVEEARSIDGNYYIGDPKFAERLWKRYGIERFELHEPKARVCMIGWSPRYARWYGWSHRAIKGFKTSQEAAVFAERVS